MKIVRSKDCGNSPKNRLIEDLAVALATGDADTVARLTTDDAEWRIVGVGELRGRAAIVAALATVDRGAASTLKIVHALSHGRAGAANGVLEHDGKRTDFCDLFEFANTKGTSISRMTSYRIDA
jgi:hypothetical protein